MSGIETTGSKRLVLVSGRAHPRSPPRSPPSSAPSSCRPMPHLRQRRDLRPLRRERPRMRRLRHPVAHLADQRVAHGAAHHARRAQARVGQAHHRRRAVLPLRPPRQEGPRPRADLRPPRRRPLQGRRRRPHHVRRPARRADPGLLRRPGRPPLRHAGAARALQQNSLDRVDPHGRLARHGPRARRRHLERQARRAARHHPQAPRPARAEPGLGARDRRPGRGPRLPARRRPDRHRPHDRQGRRGAEGHRRHRRHRRRDARRVLATRRPSSCRATSSTSVVVTDTLPLPEEKRWDRLTVLPIAPLLARAIHEVFEDGSVTSMFDGAA